MMDDIQTFIREMPLRYYLSGGLFSRQEPMIAFHVGEEEVEALVSYRKKAFGYEDELHRDPDAPPTTSYGQGYRPGANGRRVTAKLASRYRVPQRCQHLFVVDAPADELFLNLFTLDKLRRRTIDEALADLREAPGQILSGWDRPDFRWHILDPDLRFSVGTKGASEDPVLVVGLSENVCLPFEIWSDEQGAAIVGILPLAVAVLAWCNAVLPTDKKDSVILVAAEKEVVAGIIKGGKLTNLLRAQTIDDALSKIQRNLEEFGLEDPAVYLWYSKPGELGDDDVSYDGLTIIDQDHLRAVLGAPLLVMASTGKRIAHDRPVPHLLNWLAKQ
jgi:hypothetical protein